MAAVMLVVSACGSKGLKETEEIEATTAEIEAAQMQGREEARKFVSRKWSDSLELNSQLLDVAVVRGRYTEEKRYEERDAFDSAFISTVRAVRPGLADRIERDRPAE